MCDSSVGSTSGNTDCNVDIGICLRPHVEACQNQVIGHLHTYVASQLDSLSRMWMIEDVCSCDCARHGEAHQSVRAIHHLCSSIFEAPDVLEFRLIPKVGILKGQPECMHPNHTRLDIVLASAQSLLRLQILRMACYVYCYV